MSLTRTVFSKIPLVKLASIPVQQLRQSQCLKCDFYESKTGSCGPLIIGKVVEYKNKKVKLCGCIISEKSEFKNLHCPIKKW
jgi:hypothetical protein